MWGFARTAVGMTLCVMVTACGGEASYSAPWHYTEQGDVGSSPGGEGTGNGSPGWEHVFGGSPNGSSSRALGAVFAHSPTSLYKLNLSTLDLSTIGAFPGCDEGIFDIAISSTGEMFATSGISFFKVDPTDARCTRIMNSQYPNALTFVPKGVIDPDREVLVGYINSLYVEINPLTGAKTVLGDLGDGYTVSGDVVWIEDKGLYLTFKGNGCDDCLGEIDPLTGAMTGLTGPLGRSNVYGLAYWDGAVYGFDEQGAIFTIDVEDASTVEQPVTSKQPSVEFWGASAGPVGR